MNILLIPLFFSFYGIVHLLWERKINGNIISFFLAVAILYDILTNSFYGLLFSIISFIIVFIPFSFLYLKDYISEQNFKIIITLALLFKPLLLLRTFLIIFILYLMFKLLIFVENKMRIRVFPKPLKVILNKNEKNYPEEKISDLNRESMFGFSVFGGTLLSILTDLFF